MTTISHVRGCDPQAMIAFAGDLTARNESFSIEVERANRDVDNAMNNWRGDAAAAASARALSEELASNHLGQAIVTLADHYNTYGAELSGYRTALLSVVDIEIPGAGMTVDDAGTVSAPPYRPIAATRSLPDWCNRYSTHKRPVFRQGSRHC